MAESDNTLLPQIVAELFMVPWGHHRYIIDKCSSCQDKALFFVHQTVENGWSRNILLNFLDTDLYERQGKALTNFNRTLPEETSDLAQEITKDPPFTNQPAIRINSQRLRNKDAVRRQL